MTDEFLSVGDYELKLSEVLRVLSEVRAKKVLIQLPEGLKRYYTAIADYIRSKADLEVYLDGSPVYGSCLLDFGETGKYDLVIHVGHDPYPLASRRPSPRVVFVDLEYISADRETLLSEIESYLTASGLKNIAIVTTNQHKKLSELIKERLKSGGFNVALGPLVVFGCYVPSELKKSKVEAVLVVAGGVFHSIGVGMVVRSAKVVRVDPYTKCVTDSSRDVLKFLSIRLKKMHDALNARSWGVVLGISGQYRPWVVSEVVRVLKKRERRFYLYTAPILDINVLRNLDSPEVDAYVVTSCPRIAVDDLVEFEKPVLTPSEAIAVLEKMGIGEYPENLL
ncbi:MAG: diphthamide biosynthesis enzyme Dph2 [Sulfolobales archaeon]